jgi:hypothetical protein
VSPLAGLLAADRPSAAELLPEKTLVYVRVADTKDLVERFQNTAIGRIASDPSMKPLVGDLYDSAAEGFGTLEERVGASLDELLQIPHGEICLALVPVEDSRPAIVGFLEVGEGNPVAEKLLAHADEQLTLRGATRETESVGDTEITIYKAPQRSQQLAIFQRGGLIVLSNNVDQSKRLIDRWDGLAPKEEPPLSKNQNFNAVMRRCRLTDEQLPQITFYADPMELVDTATQGNFAARAALAFAPALGIDGIQGLGGSLTLAEEEYDNVFHLYLMLDSPKKGALKALALKSGDTTPESFIPRSAASYSTIHWDVEQTYVAIGELVDTFQGDGALETQVNERISQPLGLDFKDDLLAALDNRFTWTTWVEPPARLNGQANLIAVKLRNPKEFEGTLAKLRDRFPAPLEEQKYGGVTYYVGEPQDPRPARRRGFDDQGGADGADNPPAGGDRELPANFRRPQPCVAIIEDSLVMTDSEALMKEAITAQGDVERRLSEELDFKLIASKIKRESGDKAPGLLTFNRPEQGIRLLYDLAVSEDNRTRMATQAERNGFIRALSGALNDNPLPPFSVLAKYLAPGGGMMISDDSGLHYMSFGLRRQD